MSYLGQQLGQGQAERFVFTASGGETSVTTADDGRAIAYTVGQVDVYLNGAKLINGSDFTATTGTSITGLSALTASDVVEVFALSIFQASDTVSAASGGTFNGNVTMAANLSFGDNNKAIFGDGSDLQIFHNGTDSFIREVGTGGLKIDTNGPDITLRVNATESAIVANSNGSVDLYYDNSKKLATTNTGINVTGTVTADGLTVDGASAGTVTAATFTNTTSASGTRVQAVLQNVSSACNVNLVSERVGANFGADFIVETSDTVDGTDRQRLRVAETGDISFYEDTGTTAKFFWDASAESLGIGTSSPATVTEIVDTNPILQVRDSTTSAGSAAVTLRMGESDGSGNIENYWDIKVNGSDGALQFIDNWSGGAGTGTRMVISDGGNVGIGMTNPSYPLDVTGQVRFGVTGKWRTGTNTLRPDAAGGNGAMLRSQISSATNPSFSNIDDTNTGMFLPGSDVVGFSTGGTERARIDSSGNLKLGTTSITTDPGIQLFAAGGIYTHISGTSSADSMRFYRNNAEVGTITTTGTATTYNTSSDARLKENIADAEDAGATVDAIQVRAFDWKADGSHQRYGMVAQELLEVAPEAVSQPEDPDDMMGVDYSKLVPMLVKEIQSLRARVAQLEGA